MVLRAEVMKALEEERKGTKTRKWMGKTKNYCTKDKNIDERMN